MPFIEQASEAIRETGGRFTQQRRLIVELLEGAEGHLDAERLYQLAHARDETVSLATVYRTLNVLEGAGLIDQRYLSHSHERKVYEPVGASEHYHFTCTGCGRVIEFETQRVQRLKEALEVGLGVRVEHACLCLEGLCYACRTQQEGR